MSSSSSLNGQTLQSLFDPASCDRVEVSQAVSPEAKPSSHRWNRRLPTRPTSSSIASNAPDRRPAQRDQDQAHREHRQAIRPPPEAARARDRGLETQVKKLKELVRKRQEAARKSSPGGSIRFCARPTAWAGSSPGRGQRAARPPRASFDPSHESHRHRIRCVPASCGGPQ